MAKEVRFSVTEGPGFLPSMGLEVEDGGTVAIVAYNKRGECYVFSRITMGEFRAAVSILDPEGEVANGDAEVRRGGD